jgi:hypothetical protein
MRFVYSVIRFVPDPARGEFVNIGAIAGSDAAGEWDVRTLSNKKRARYIDDHAILGRVVGIVEDIGRRLDRASQGSEPLLETEEQPSEGWLTRLAAEYNNTLQFSRPLPIVAESTEEVLDFAFSELLLEPTSTRLGYKSKNVAFHRARAAYTDGGVRPDVELIERAPVETIHYHDRFDFLVANGSAVQLAQAWSFQLPDQEELIRDLKAWAWTVRDIRIEGGSVLTTRRRIEVPKDVDVAAIYIASSPGASTEAFKVANALCNDADVRLVPLEHVVSDVVARARDSLTHNR